MAFPQASEPPAQSINGPPDLLESMSRPIVIGATVVAALLAVAAFVMLLMEQLVISGTLFMFTSFALYIRESNK